MKSITFIAAFAVAGCSNDHSSSPAAQRASPVDHAATTSGGAAKRPNSTPGIDSLLKVLGKEEKISIRYDRVVEAKTGDMQRQVFIEMLGASDREADSAVTKAFAAQGLTLHRGKDDEHGVRLRFVKAQMEPIEVLIRSRQEGPKLKDPAATSSVYLRQTAK
ncbi:hypothetical protein [Dyella sp.]|uniref:hypothetical protein n=1 Tax=Dyella sp. TaxID=1869338 RepID=UPI002D78BBB3|nr:hypothetical protein [Dyella sp.]HET6430813.1 hypothetical protein [Dyella sp.]